MNCYGGGNEAEKGCKFGIARAQYVKKEASYFSREISTDEYLIFDGQLACQEFNQVYQAIRIQSQSQTHWGFPCRSLLDFARGDAVQAATVSFRPMQFHEIWRSC